MFLTRNRKMRIKIQLLMLLLYFDSKGTAIKEGNMAPCFIAVLELNVKMYVWHLKQVAT